MPSPTFIPSRFRLGQFDAIAPALAKALEAVKNNRAILLDPSPWTAETMARKLHEAIEAKRLYHHRHGAINEDDFARYAPLLATSQKDPNNQGNLWVGTEEAIHNALASPATATVVANSNHKSNGHNSNGTIIFDFKKSSVVTPIILVDCILNGTFEPCPQFIFANIPQDTITKLESLYEVGFVPVDDQPECWHLIR